MALNTSRIRATIGDWIAAMAFLLIAITITMLVQLGQLTSTLRIVASWAGLLVVVGTPYVCLLVKRTKETDRLLESYLPAFEELSIAFDRGAKRLSQEGDGELKRICKADKENDKEVLEVLCWPRFRSNLASWGETNTIASFHAIESVRELCNNWLMPDLTRRITREFSTDSILDFVCERYVSTDGIGGWGAKQGDDPSLESSYCAVRIVQTVMKMRGKRADYDTFEAIVGKERLGKLLAYLAACRDSETGGFRDRCWADSYPSITDTGLVTRICSVLYADEGKGNRACSMEHMGEILGSKPNPTPDAFILSCFADVEGREGDVAAFSDRPGSDGELPGHWVCINYFAATCLDLLGQKDEIRNSEKSAKLAAYLKMCEVPLSIPGQEGEAIGFVAQPSYTTENLMHTYFALKTALLLCPDYLANREEAFFDSVSRYAVSCRSRKGYGFRSGWAPNVFATCVARHITELVDSKKKTGSTGFDPVESLQFYLSCFSPNESGFVGYELAPES